jgi:hypothetical protein
MGNWRTVHIMGTCNEKELPTLKAAISLDYSDEDWHCLCNGGLCGLPVWAQERIDVTGNLAERDYDENDVAKTLEQLAKKAPSLAVEVDIGGNYESKDVAATIILERGKARIDIPRRATIPDVTETQIMGQFMAQLNKAGRVR